MLSATELKTGLRRLGVPFVTNKQVRALIEEFDDDGDNGINQVEFLTHYGRLLENRSSTIAGQLIHLLLYHPKDRVVPLRSSRFVERFR